jgi:hypothetical protein
MNKPIRYAGRDITIIEAKRNIDLVLIRNEKGQLRYRSKKDFTPEQLRDHWRERRNETKDGQL